MATIELGLNVPPKKPEPPLRGWYVVQDKGVGRFRVVYIMTAGLMYKDGTVLFLDTNGGMITHGSVKYLHRDYDIVRPLGPNDTITITGE